MTVTFVEGVSQTATSESTNIVATTQVAQAPGAADLQIRGLVESDIGDRRLDELLDVQITNPSDGQILRYNQGADRFENANPDAAAPATFGGLSGASRDNPDLNAELDLKQDVITPGTTSQFYRGDKQFVSIDKTTVGLANVDNTSDANKPISTAQAAALATKSSIMSILKNGVSIGTLVGVVELNLEGDLEGAISGNRVTISTQSIAANVTDPAISTVRSNGWVVDYSTPPLMQPDTAPRYLVVSRQGFNSLGQPANFIQDIILTKRSRSPFPDQDTLTATEVALSEYVFAADTIVGSVANNSTKVAPKPVAHWAMLDRGTVGNTLRLEVTAAHGWARDGEQVACVEFSATDGVTTVTQIVSASEILAHATDKNAVIGYAANLNITTLAEGQITANAKVYPWVGTSASVLDSSTVTAEREFSPRIFRKSLTGRKYAYVKTTGNDGTGVISTTAATADATPFLTVLGAINALHTAGGMDNTEIRVGAGTFVLGSTAATRTQTFSDCTITRDPNVAISAAIVSFGAASFRTRFRFLRFKDITIERTGTLTLQGEAAPNQMLVTFENVTFNNNNHNAAFLSNAHAYFDGATIGGPANSLFNPSTIPELRLFRGASYGAAGATQYSLEAWSIIGCDLTQVQIKDIITRRANGAFIGFNKFIGLGGSSAFINLDITNPTLSGFALIQNSIEWSSATSNPAIRLGADGEQTSTSHIIMHHNTVSGYGINGRNNFFYDETNAVLRTHEFISMRGNIFVSGNTKHDVFTGSNHAGYTPSPSLRVGGWSVLYGVGCVGNLYQHRDADGGGLGSPFFFEYPGLRAIVPTDTGQVIDPLFADNKAATVGPVAGAGGGSYIIDDESPAVAGLFFEERPLKFDLRGLSRTTSTALGAYVPINGDVTIPKPVGAPPVTPPIVGSPTGGAPWDGTTGPLSLTIDGLKLDFGDVASSGQFKDGSYWIEKNAHADGAWLQAVSIDPGETVDLFVGGVMLDPGRPGFEDMRYHGWDWRTTGNKTNPSAPPSGSGPGVNFRANYSVALPCRVKPWANGPVTIWAYRGVDNSNLTSGGGASGCAYMVQVTVYANGQAPGANKIKPPGVYVASGKVTLADSDINYAALPTTAIPTGATIPNFSDLKGYHVRPTWRHGYRNEAAATSPKRTQDEYPADQMVFTASLVAGALTTPTGALTETVRRGLIERIVRDGMNAYAGSLLTNNTAFLGAGGFGIGGELEAFIGSYYIEGSNPTLATAMRAQPPTITNDTITGIPFWASRSSMYWSVLKIGDVPNAGGTREALYGTMEKVTTNGFVNSHTSRDPASIRDSFRLAQFTGTVVAATADSITFAADHSATRSPQPSVDTNQPYHRNIVITSGVAAGQIGSLRTKQAGIDVSWNGDTKVALIETAASWSNGGWWNPDTSTSVTPQPGDTYEYRNAAVYEQICAASFLDMAICVVLAGKTADWNHSAHIMYALKHYNRSGLLMPGRKPTTYYQRTANATSRIYGPAEQVIMGGKWLKLWMEQRAQPIWPNFTGP